MFKKFIAVVCLGALSVGCKGLTSSFEEEGKTSVNAAGILASTANPDDKAEQLAKAAEQLLTVQGFAYANDVADLALQQDSSNFRAKLIKAVLAPIMVQRGILARVEPLADKDLKLREEYDKFVSDLEMKTPNSTLKTFLLDGRPDISSEADVQNYVDSVVESFATLRQFAKDNKDANITVMTSDAFYQVMLRRFQDSCTVVMTKPYEYEYRCPSPVKMLEVTFSRADFEAIQQMAAGYELYYSLYNSYELTSAIQVALKFKDEYHAPQSVIEELLKDSKFGTLRAGNAFKRIRQMGVDAVVGMRWVLSNQDTLCPMGKASPRNRIGALVNTGLCLEYTSDVSVGLKKAAQILAGKEIAVTFEVNDYTYPYSTVVRPGALMDSPIADLRSLTPLKFNKCNLVEEIADGSVGGLFPKADANEVLLRTSYCGQ